MKHISEIIDEAMAVDPEPIKTGLWLLDEQIGGYYPSELTTICGGTNVGKTAFLIHQVNRMAIDLGVETYFYAGLVSEQVWLSLMVAYYCGIQTQDLHTMLHAPEYAAAVNAYLKKLKEAPLFVEFYNREFYIKPELEHVMDVVKRKHVKIAFFDDNMPLTWLKQLALACRIPVVATEEAPFTGLEGCRSSLNDLFWRNDSDVVIGIVDYEGDQIFEDEQGRNLCGLLGLEVLKHKGKLKKPCLEISKSSLYVKEYERQCLDELKMQDPYVSSLIDKLNMQLMDYDDWPAED